MDINIEELGKKERVFVEGNEEVERVHKHLRDSTWEYNKCYQSWESSSYESIL